MSNVIIVMRMLVPCKQKIRQCDKDAGELLSFMYQCETSSRYLAVSPANILGKGFLAQFHTRAVNAAIKIPQFELD
jgi:hypothetical protein